MLEQNKAVVRAYWEAFGAHDIDGMVRCLAPDFVSHDPALPNPDGDLASERAQVEGTYATFPDLALGVEDLIAEGDMVVSRWTWTATHTGEIHGAVPIPPTGRKVTVEVISIQRMASGKIAEKWISFDALGLLQQLGAAPIAR
jgi:steroid delta-isomerase-like uncharacterized protein